MHLSTLQTRMLWLSRRMIVDGRVMRLNYTDVAVIGWSIWKVKVPHLSLYCQLVEGSLRVEFSDISDVVVFGED